MTLGASKGKEELPGWADNIDFDQDRGKRNTEREREGGKGGQEQAVCKTSNFPLFLRSKLPP